MFAAAAIALGAILMRIGIMESHGGSISVASERGIGTTIILRLPTIIEEQAAREKLISGKSAYE